MSGLAVVKHPAAYSDAVLSTFDKLLDRRPMLVLDPFAGIGRIGWLKLNHLRPTITIANELEMEWATQAVAGTITTVGDATALPYRSGVFDAVCTSPVYGNRMSDHHEARDGSHRITYRHYLGHPLHPRNAGQMQWGKEYRALHSDAWAEVYRVLKPGGQFLINLKDHIRDKERQAVVKWHFGCCVVMGFEFEKIRCVTAKGMRKGQNHDARIPVEHVLAFRKPA